ncbi:MAG TPA: DUF2911 domain-containing protein [Hanamia sp.]|nr:DUF2911 domain-containing protein [Hanamia sp.]
MKKVFLSILFTGFISFAFAQVRMPAASPTQYIKQDFGLSSIELTYSRPGLKGREMIGQVLPWNVLWRTGANAATKIQFNDAVEILGHKVDAGSYAIYTIPQKNGEWTLVLNKGFDNSGVSGYKESEDVFRTTVKAGKNASKVETLTMQFSDVKPESCVLNIKWESFALKIPITTNVKDKLRAQIEKDLQSDKKPYWQAAQFYNDLDNNKAKALEMINGAIAQSEKPPFYMVYYKASIQKDLGDKKGALATAQQSLKLSKEAKEGSYILLNEKLIKELK